MHSMSRERTSTPQWARATMAIHTPDPREDNYTVEELETASIHDAL